MSQAFRRPLRQPDQRSCGAASLVVARMAGDPEYAEFVLTGRHPGTGLMAAGSRTDRFSAETLAVHERVTGPADASGRMQLPWPRALGTPPWAVAREMSATSDTAYDSAAVNPFRRGRALRAIVSATGTGCVVPLYVGNRWTPRHVVLVLSPGLDVYEPASGRRVRFTQEAFVKGRLDLAGWDKPWFAVLPG